MNDQNTETLTDKPVADRTLAIRQAIKAGDRGLILATMDDFARFAMKVAASQFCPPGFSEVDCFICLQKGAEVGLTPMQSLESIYVVNNRATLFGDTPLALVRSSGLLASYKQEEIGSYPNDDYGYRITTLRKGEPDPIVTTYTVAKAKIAKLWGKTGRNGQDTSWITAPDRMLMFRARGFNLRDNFSDVLKGLQIGELVDDIGFEHAKSAIGRIVEPNFGSLAQESPEPPKRRGRPPKQAPIEPPKSPPDASKSPESITTTAPPENAPESAKAAKPQQEMPFGNVDDPLLEIRQRLKTAKIPEDQFVELMVKLGYFDAELEEIRAGFIGIEKCDTDTLRLALIDWDGVIKKLTAAP